MKKIMLTLLAICFSIAAYAGSPHETVCGGAAIQAAEAILRINSKNIDSVAQDSESMKLIAFAHSTNGSFEKWDIALNVKEKKMATVYRATIVRILSSIEFGADGSVECSVREISIPFAD